MNFLAHCYLAFGDDELLVGQFIADDIKGKKYKQYLWRIQQGILLHRFIDSTTDTHEACRKLRALLRPALGLLSPVAIDVFLDHALASRWHLYHSDSLEEFAEITYQKLSANKHYLTPHTSILLDHMKHNNWLVMYKTVAGTSTLLQQMSRRLPYGEILEKAPDILQEHYEEVMKTFEIFFPQLNDWTKAKLDTFANQHP